MFVATIKCMKHLFFALVAILGLAFSATPVQAAAVNNFAITNYDIHYELGVDSEGRSMLTTTEEITALFPNYDQNRGIERAIPNTYQGHSTSVKVVSVEQGNGTPWQYSSREVNSNTILRIGDPAQYVRGEQTYVIKYTQKDVTKNFSDTKADEFYWDTNGTEWKVPIDRLAVTLSVDRAIADKLSGKTACYRGSSGENNRCDILREDNQFTVRADSLSAGENVTIAAGFEPGTFASYQPSLLQKLFIGWIIVSAIIGAVAVGIIVWLLLRWRAWSSRRKDIGAIAPEYLPPKDVSISTIASVVRLPRSIFTAQLMDLAVRHYIKIYEINKKTLFKAADYRIEVIKDPSSLLAEEREILSDIFGVTPAIGTTIELSTLKNNQQTYSRFQDNETKLRKLIREEYGMRSKNTSQSAWFKKAGWILLVIAILTLNPVMLAASIAAFVAGFTLWPLTDRGVALSRYAEGMKMYIHVAEAERLRYLQSPEGATKLEAGVNVGDPAQLVKLYERMLPYAILFGEEKEWSKRIGDLYESAQLTPDWYMGQTAFNAAIFSSAIGSFASSVSYSAPYESSSGGSSGSGFSGGGGGGGGGGGW